MALVSWWYDTTPTNVTDVTDSAGNTYVQAGSRVTRSGTAMEIWYCLGADSVASMTMTATFDSANTRVAKLQGVEITVSGGEGEHSLGVVGGQGMANPGTNPSTITTGTLASTAAPHFVIAMSANDGWPDVWDPGTGFTELNQFGSQFSGGGWTFCEVEYDIQSVAGAATAEWSTDGSGSSNFVSMAATFGPSVPVIPDPVAHAPIDNVWAPLFDSLF